MASSSHHHHHPHRSSSPGRRAIKNSNYGHYSDLSMNPSSTRDTYVSARSSGDRLVPPTQYARDSRTDYHDKNDDRYYEPQQRSRRSTFSDTAPPILNIPRSTASSGRPNSPLPPTSNPKVVKKTYVIGDNKTTLVDNKDLNPRASRESYSSTDRLDRPSEPSHRRRASAERTNYFVTTGSRGEKIYHLVDPHQHSNRDSVIQSAYPELTDYYQDDPYTSESRARVRRSSTAARERPKSFIFDSRSNYHERDPGPPSSRALDNYNEGVLRSNNARIDTQTDRRGYDQPPPRDYVASPAAQYRTDTAPPSASQEGDRARDSTAFYAHDRDSHTTTSTARHRDNYERGSYDDAYTPDTRYREQRESRNPERTPTQRYHDVSVERRGFGLRPASRDRGDERIPRSDTERRPSPPESQPVKYEPRVKEERPREKEPLRSSRDDLSDYDRDVPRYKERSGRPRDYDREYGREHERGAYERDRDHREVRPEPKHEKAHHRSASELLSAAVVGGIGVSGAAALAKDSGRDTGRDSGRDSYRRDRRHDSESSDSNDSRSGRPSHRTRQRESDAMPRDPPRSEASRQYAANDLDVVGGPSESAQRAVGAPITSKAPPKSRPDASDFIDADEDYRRRLQQAQEVYRSPIEPVPTLRPAQDSIGRSLPVQTLDTRPREPERTSDVQYTEQARSAVSERDARRSPKAENDRPPPSATRDSPTQRVGSSGSSEGTRDVAERKQVRIVEPSAESETRPKGILKRPKDQFPEHPNPVREGVAPLKDKLQLKGIPPGAKWTKVSRKIVNVQALEDAGERFEEREDHVIVLRVLNQEDIRKLAERTQLIRERRPRHRSEETTSSDRDHRRQSSRRSEDEDEYYSDSSFDEFSEHRRPPRMLEAGPSAQPSSSSAAPTTPNTSAPTPSSATANIPAQFAGGYPASTPGQTQVLPLGDEYRRDARDRSGAR